MMQKAEDKPQIYQKTGEFVARWYGHFSLSRFYISHMNSHGTSLHFKKIFPILDKDKKAVWILGFTN